jgi:hypothetical protein
VTQRLDALQGKPPAFYTTSQRCTKRLLGSLRVAMGTTTFQLDARTQPISETLLALHWPSSCWRTVPLLTYPSASSTQESNLYICRRIKRSLLVGDIRTLDMPLRDLEGCSRAVSKGERVGAGAPLGQRLPVTERSRAELPVCW